MYRLKQTLRHVYPYPGDFVLHSGKRYQLNESLISTDRRRFEKLAAGVLREEVSTETVPYLEEMVSLYRGEYLADLDYVWVIQDREHLQQLYSDVSIKLAQYYFKEGQYSEVIKYLRPLTAANPVSEELCCLLMKAYAGIGDKRAIAKQYRALRTALAEELGLSPSAATRNLYYRLCRN
jgi:two-component SAPR family response regulator